MKVLVDTSVWSLVLRRSSSMNLEYQKILEQLISDYRIQMIGPIRQELLSGIKESHQFELLKERLSAFPDYPLQTNDFELAAEYFNQCKNKGVQGSNTDYLICAIAANNDWEIFTTDKDFDNFQAYLPIKLYSV